MGRDNPTLVGNNDRTEHKYPRVLLILYCYRKSESLWYYGVQCIHPMITRYSVVKCTSSEQIVVDISSYASSMTTCRTLTSSGTLDQSS